MDNSQARLHPTQNHPPIANLMSRQTQSLPYTRTASKSYFVSTLGRSINTVDALGFRCPFVVVITTWTNEFYRLIMWYVREYFLLFVLHLSEIIFTGCFLVLILWGEEYVTFPSVDLCSWNLDKHDMGISFFKKDLSRLLGKRELNGEITFSLLMLLLRLSCQAWEPWLWILIGWPCQIIWVSPGLLYKKIVSIELVNG